MRKTISMIALLFAFAPLAHPQETLGDKAREAKQDAVEAKREAGREIRSAGRKAKKAGRRARQAVITRCADGRHTVKGAAGCRGHGGVYDPR